MKTQKEANAADKDKDREEVAEIDAKIKQKEKDRLSKKKIGPGVNLTAEEVAQLLPTLKEDLRSQYLDKRVV